jgi:sec-independent protein translocase protein TatA
MAQELPQRRRAVSTKIASLTGARSRHAKMSGNTFCIASGPALRSDMERFYLGFGLGMQEMIVIFLIVLLLFGAKKIPELARGIGKGMGEFKKAKHEFEREITMGEEEGKKEWDRAPKEREKTPDSHSQD